MDVESKFSEVGCNTDISFRPNDDVSFSVNIAEEIMDSEEYDIEDDANDLTPPFNSMRRRQKQRAKTKTMEMQWLRMKHSSTDENMKYVMFFSSPLLLLNKLSHMW